MSLSTGASTYAMQPVQANRQMAAAAAVRSFVGTSLPCGGEHYPFLKDAIMAFRRLRPPFVRREIGLLLFYRNNMPLRDSTHTHIT